MPQESETRTVTAERPGAAGAPGAPAPGNTRRGVLVGAGLAGVAGLAAACGGGDDSSKDEGDGGGSAGSRPGGGNKALGASSEIPVGGGKVFEGEKVVVCQPAQGQFTAFSAICTHRGCTVGSVSGGTINCPCHGSKFKITDGSVANPPATEPLPKKTVTVQGGQITLT
ncbi:Rieske (2Fe-2S) protein [Actinomadura roseirufa]|uniref:Rieske (2Fe-2S) protein n=1 Tax=Actinomadura roseirufa TaxID=2094049 RepID=UPI0010417E99|nr:Rieske (2Fe-2S) protein [Actinomadura roseirufa]